LAKSPKKVSTSKDRTRGEKIRGGSREHLVKNHPGCEGPIKGTDNRTATKKKGQKRKKKRKKPEQFHFSKPVPRQKVLQKLLGRTPIYLECMRDDNNQKRGK